jgi:NAD(P)H-dependent flavin oxidoreductase YrpB (nitropropane dioxygenase family)
VDALSGVEWRSPEIFEGHLRLIRRDDDGAAPPTPDQDPAAVVFGLGYGPVHESLPFAAAVLAAVREARPVVAVPAARRDPADIAERIRHLGELHQAGLVTDEEFSVKKAELLAQL